ncbi:MAG: YggS family pyridoxal phosphate-dependent enzyme [Candidatus Omnitrophica bacterium]|nr:YggS family pyridoxal phosphate-dependent enzyme [Candidatus Omnitrophota bacterium]
MIADRISLLQRQLALRCQRAGRLPQDITLVAVSKGRSVQDIEAALSAGIQHVGENRVQEASIKHGALRKVCQDKGCSWHLIGHLQTNKVNDAVRIFDLIHSVDSLKLAEHIDKVAAHIGKTQEILLQVNVSGEQSKFGLRPEDALSVVEHIRDLKNVSLRGFMTIAPLSDDPENARPFFSRLRVLRDTINSRLNTHNSIQHLSMGMTDDFEIAVEEGATIVRIGRAIFEG